MLLTGGLAPHFKDLLKTKLQNSEFLVISFDESLNKSTQNCQMDIGIRFWSQEAKQVEVRYWDSQFLGHATSGDLLENFNKSLVGLDLSKIIQISMDGPSVNWCFYDKVVKNREEMELHQLINIGSCGLHIIHYIVSVKEAVEDELTTVKLSFFSYLASIFQPFLAKYQTQAPMIPYMYSDIVKLIRSLMLIVVKHDIIDGCMSGQDLRKIDLDKENVYKEKEGI